MSGRQCSLAPYSLVQDDYSRPGISSDISSGFSILNICPLTSLHLGIAKMSHFATEGIEAVRVFPLPPGPSSWLASIPSRYGNVQSLSYAADCLVEGLKWSLCSNGAVDGGTSVARLYVRVLKSLQVALGEGEESTTTETLCAAALLGTFELLDAGRSFGWMQQAGGVAQLIEYRGPDRFDEAFDKAILLAHIGPLVTQALMNGTQCFLTEEEELISSEHPVLEPTIADLIDHTLRFRGVLVSWYRKYRAEIGLFDNTNAYDTFDYLDCRPCSKILQHVQLHGTYLSCIILASRLIFALAPARFRYFEVKCQDPAEKVAQQRERARNANHSLSSGLFITQTWWIAKATIDTKIEWAENVMEDGRYADGHMLESWKFKLWTKALGRKSRLQQ
ncbi:uncharacterized protein A1O5_08360 [Cladophialophora psammophila CBS 110553]|uniref:Transcription factor domain-containing protein n=1 Tax=Cladophialophora psammophila CBS 110553 TaxID=1182543 RepID=W9WV85_9EURO|nr:uncharacterized protein A1O5_08360 [Cladophialophora psammophila CBS 110553]EXJ68566.1 hypothetical protein A1O5_08360 [Cladophialophora psammophila CBS 110553]